MNTDGNFASGLNHHFFKQKKRCSCLDLSMQSVVDTGFMEKFSWVEEVSLTSANVG